MGGTERTNIQDALALGEDQRGEGRSGGNLEKCVFVWGLTEISREKVW